MRSMFNLHTNIFAIIKYGKFSPSQPFIAVRKQINEFGEKNQPKFQFPKCAFFL